MMFFYISNAKNKKGLISIYLPEWSPLNRIYSSIKSIIPQIIKKLNSKYVLTIQYLFSCYQYMLFIILEMKKMSLLLGPFLIILAFFSKLTNRQSPICYAFFFVDNLQFLIKFSNCPGHGFCSFVCLALIFKPSLDSRLTAHHAASDWPALFLLCLDNLNFKTSI